VITIIKWFEHSENFALYCKSACVAYVYMRKHSIDSDASALIEHLKYFAQECKSACVASADMKEHSARSDASAQ